MIVISEQLKTKLKSAERYLKILADPVLAEGEFDCVFAIRDDHDEVIPGALRYCVSADGPAAAILGGIHMNEMSGVFALLKFHERWVKGVRPSSGAVYVAAGKIERALEFIDAVMGAEEMSPESWSAFHATKDHFNYNRIPFDILTRTISNHFEKHACQIIKYILGPAKGRILDLHNTSLDAPPMVTMFMDKGEAPEMSVNRVVATGATRDLPIRDYILWKPGPYNAMESIRSLSETESGAMPILIENGGGANPASFEAADIHTQIWLRNVMGMEPDKDLAEREANSAGGNIYVETHALYHPDVRPQDYSHLDKATLEEAKKDIFVLIRDWHSAKAITGWSGKAQKALNLLAAENCSQDRLDNFMAIKKGDILAIGLNTGLALRSPGDGVVMMVGASPVIKPAFRETFANIGIMFPFPS